ncbi:mechanosensitive ion channel family protein [Aequorivita vladivostokensis]|uniref:Mechanosensitive ion channel protein MscS n=1 Tax=Aequorivita vladivostokensis TaxID=171194 RepID=A0ABR5DH83_9FLAO|nr:mechanosensitive ion channel domain-containing protein [Aequorivita vladivostokensis]KJJ38147.1 mechanosensitive ion channel protein MscS [Aequorivita vladivostokensis]MAB57093.1 mechanosensitive ion channel protein MscS [Aequorivita sp.]MBF30376.1 mechanosensitive ion channel protein MscS [Aequorivita sp.]|tara:strand:- start:147484 stop:148767 length:1284 start_codon:yes stop_codon:yes gene_type:complete
MNKEAIQDYSCLFQNYLVNQGMAVEWAIFLNVLINCAIVITAVIILDIVFRKFIIEIFRAFSDKTKTTFDDYLVKSNFPRFIAHLLPLGIVWYLIPIIFIESPFMTNLLQIAAKVYLVILCVLIFRSILRTTRNYLEENEHYRDKPMESYVQVMMIFAWGIGIFWTVQLLTGFSVVSLTTLGAASAVILLIFKDTILGFVASIQVSVNDIVRIGDWITFSKFGADGYVTEINLATVRVQNWDNTYTTIPTYSLIADSFQNWRGMQESDGRRIKRSIYIKQSSIKFLSVKDVERLKKIQLIKPYLEHRQRDVDRYNERNEINKDLLINGRNQTNLGVFRYYADAFLNENSAINKDLFLMVRHLAPTDKGIPVEIFCFSKDKRWVNYEHIQADIFDHLLAAIPYFDLEVFELPTGKDLSSAIHNQVSEN